MYLIVFFLAIQKEHEMEGLLYIYAYKQMYILRKLARSVFVFGSTLNPMNSSYVEIKIIGDLYIYRERSMCGILLETDGKKSK
jgi:biotin-(acetyl-CoA carboxylase) ligase